MTVPSLKRIHTPSRSLQAVQSYSIEASRSLRDLEARIEAAERHIPIARGIVTGDGSGGASFVGFGFRKVITNSNDLRCYIPIQTSTRYEVYAMPRASNPIGFWSIATDSITTEFFDIEAHDDTGAGINLSTTATQWNVVVLPEAA